LQQVDADYFEPDELLDDEQEIWLGEYPFEAIWTPGHSPDHFCFYNRSDRLLLAGDHVLNEISPMIPIWSEEEGNPLQLYFDSLERVSALPVDLALPGHGSVIHDVTARISQIREGHEQRMQQIVDAIGQEGSTAGQVCQSVYQLPRIGSRNLAEFLMTLTRLLYLEAAGKVSSVERSGKVIFSVES
jgi:glyoxylase-like metal-dependent hydrolase (beta-lactamase superfamily II)